MKKPERPTDRIPYKLPKIYFGKKEQFVHYSYWCKTELKYVRRKFRCNLYQMTDAEKKVELKDALKRITATLLDRNRLWQYQDEFWEDAPAKALKYSFEIWVKMAIEAETGTDRRQTYTKLLYNVNAFIAQDSKIRGVAAPIWAAKYSYKFAAWLQKSGLSGKSVNDMIWAHTKVGEWIKRSLTDLDWPTLKDFRVKKIKNESGKYLPFTHEEKERVFQYYQHRNPAFYLHLILVYYTCIRPAELHRLKVSDFDLKGKKISVNWMSAKNGLSKHVQILAPLLDALQEYGIADLPADFFLFGRNGKPTPEPVGHKGWSSNYWGRHAEALGLKGSGKTVYSFKHTFNIDYVENNKKNVDWEWLRRHNRHATVAQTQEYISELTAYFLDENTAKILDYVR